MCFNFTKTLLKSQALLDITCKLKPHCSRYECTIYILLCENALCNANSYYING